MANPAFRNDPFGTARQNAVPAGDVGWGMPQQAATAPGGPPPLPGSFGGPSAAGPVVTASPTMTRGGTVLATSVLLAIVIGLGVVGWSAVKITLGVDVDGNTVSSAAVPGWIWISAFAGFGLAILTIFKPTWARVSAPVYAAAQGLIVGAISHVYEVQFDGIVLQAIGLTVGVLVMMLFLYATGLIKVTARLRTGIIAATGAVCLVYLATLVLGLFSVDVPFIHDAGPVGIGFSLLVVGIAAANLLLDFDFIDRGVQVQAPRYMEWYAAFGLLVTLIWLYLEILRLLAKLRSR